MAASSRSTYTAIDDRESLVALFESPPGQPAVLFLHDWTCPISDRALDEVDRLGVQVHTVDVTSRQDLNRAVAELTGVRHESPQAFVIAGGSVTWHASHGAIRSAILIEALAAARST